MSLSRDLAARTGLATVLAALLALPAAGQEATQEQPPQPRPQQIEPAPDQPAQPAPRQPEQQQAGEELPGEEPELEPAQFVGRQGQHVGTAAVRGVATGGVLIDIQVEGLPPEQWLGFHIHEEGACNPEDNFESAGGHFNPAGAEHGFFVEGGPHAGDMPNQHVPPDGLLRAQVYNQMVSLDGDDGIRGRALVIHEGPDDYESQPSGDSGDRIACAVIE